MKTLITLLLLLGCEPQPQDHYPTEPDRQDHGGGRLGDRKLER